MAFESTAINDLVAGLQQKPLAREDEVDWLFGERDDATELDPRVRQAPEFDPMRAVSLPRPFAQLPATAPTFDPDLLRHRSPPPARTVDWLGIAKKLALPIGVLSIVIVVLGVYFAKTDRAPANAAVVTAKVEPALEAAPAPAAMPLAQAGLAAEPAAAAEPVAAAAGAEPVAAAAGAEPVAAAAAAASGQAVVAPAAEPVAAEPEEKLNVDPGSPASRFLAPAPVETTLEARAEQPAPAPTAVPELAPPAGAPPVAKIAKVAPRPKRVAKPVARKNARAAPARPTKKAVAAASSDQVAPKLTGKGILQIASSPSMQVWVDGRNSKAMTPVRIRLLAGKHRVSLLDNQRGKARSFDVVIKPDETTKVTKSY